MTRILVIVAATLLTLASLSVVFGGLVFARTVAQEREHGRTLVELRTRLVKSEAAVQWHMATDSAAFARASGLVDLNAGAP